MKSSNFILISLALLLTFVCCLSAFNFNMDSHLKALVHNSNINHRFRVSHFVTKYTSQQTKFLDNFKSQIMGFMLSDPEILATMQQGFKMTDSQSTRLFQFMVNNKDFPKYLILTMRNDSSLAWLQKVPQNAQLRFAQFFIDQMKATQTMELTKVQMRKIMLKVLNDKNLGKVFAKYTKQIDLNKLTTQAELVKLQKKYPALSKINSKKITDDDRVLIMKTLISDDQYWDQMMA